jgi:hypothetical protein
LSPAHAHTALADEWVSTSGVPIEIKKYLLLLDWTGRELRRDKRGTIPDHLAPILDRHAPLTIEDPGAPGLTTRQAGKRPVVGAR